jgi:hypothetical protein
MYSEEGFEGRAKCYKNKYELMSRALIGEITKEEMEVLRNLVKIELTNEENK